MLSKRFLALFLLVAAPAGAATYTISNDTYIDSYYYKDPGSGTVTDNADTNYGVSAAAKAVSSLTSSSFPGASSNTHLLFTLPASFWSAIGSGPVTSPVTVTYYMLTNTMQANSVVSATTTPTPNSVGGFRQLELHPMTQAFTAGTGGTNNSTMGGTLNAGATWNSTDGTTAWTTAGGSFDANDEVLNNPVITASFNTLSPVSWDISSLLNNATTRDDMQKYGLLARVTDEYQYTGNEFATLFSYDASMAAGRVIMKSGGKTYTIPASSSIVPTVSFVPEPACLSILSGLTLVALRRGRKA